MRLGKNVKAVIAASLLVVLLVGATLGVGLARGARTASAQAAAYLTIPAAAFTPDLSTTEYRNNGWRLFSFGAEGQGVSYFHAPLKLPQGVTIHNVTIYGYDGHSGDAVVVMVRRIPHHPNAQNPTFDWLTVLVSGWDNSWDGGYFTTGAGPDTAYNLIDNENYAYFLTTEMPHSPEDPAQNPPRYQLFQVRFQYSYSTYLPQVQNSPTGFSSWDVPLDTGAAR